MKSYLLLLLLVSSVAAPAQVTKFRCFKTVLSHWEGHHYEQVDENKTNFLVVLNRKNSRILVYANEETDYDIIKVDKQWVDEEGVAWSHFQAVDQDGRKRFVSFASDDANNYYSIMIDKEGYLLTYFIKRDE